jgi:hypothetical protein
MFVPADQLVKVAIVSGIAPVAGQRGEYVVNVIFDGAPEVFHVELEGPKTSFKVQEHKYYEYCMRCRSLKGLVALMRKWHRGERPELPVDLATVDFV